MNKEKMNKQELIEKYEYMSHACFRRVDTLEVLKDLEQLDEPQPLKLKDIISRMKQLFPLSRSEWIDEILKEFGEEFGSIKYRSGYEQGKLQGTVEREKVVIPQFVAEHIKHAKEIGRDLQDAMNSSSIHKEVDEWLYTDDNMGDFARAWLDGYEVEKEPKYTVKIKATKHYFAKDGNGRIYFSLKYESAFTKIELEKVNLGWIFDCEGIEVEEVEE